MTCFECAKEITAYPCACGYKPKELRVQEQWLVRRCTAPHCAVMVREQLADHEPAPVCKWHKGARAYNSMAIASRPDGGPLISRDEFGQDLFEAIQVQSEIRSCYRNAQIERGKDRKKKADEIELHAIELQKHLEAILRKNTIATPDLQRLLAIT